MKNKKLLMYIIIIIIILIVLGLGYLVYINLENSKLNNEIIEYIPQQEISEKQLRTTNIEIFYLNKNTNQLEKEIKNIDAKELLNNPSKKIIELLLEKPNSDDYVSIIPENTILNNSYISKGILYLDFSEHFIKDENLGKEKELLIIDSIKETVKQLIEVESIRILIDGQENMSFNDNQVTFKNNFNLY